MMIMIRNNSRDRVCEYLNGFIGNIPEAIKITVLGDVKTGLHARKEGEENHIGPNIYGRGAYFIRNKELLTPGEATNREHFTVLLGANTFFQKEDKHNITYQQRYSNDGGPPWDTERYCELDHCPVRKQWSNSVIDTRSDPYTNINTDHKSQ